MEKKKTKTGEIRFLTALKWPALAALVLIAVYYAIPTTAQRIGLDRYAPEEIAAVEFIRDGAVEYTLTNAEKISAVMRRVSGERRIAFLSGGEAPAFSLRFIPKASGAAQPWLDVMKADDLWYSFTDFEFTGKKQQVTTVLYE